MSLLLVIAGAAIGAPLRYLSDRAIQSRHDTVFPWGTFTVNVLGSLVLGVVTGAVTAGGASLQVPVEVRPERRTALAMRWIISYTRARREKDMSERLAAELILASKGEGESIKKKEDTHRMAEANRAFAHYRW